ncbi:hypothetical protein [Facklamia sp. 7083-14-GEN3]|uniref:hypothetical protein n=1 Tax=Facklamia sp. 7083-14-GEN3 TaxID=2973478 RepID=UPI00215D48B5|nr:hypothetical protein [Facklamia sp. 7083-14-GEN3]MCR8969607.1 hypothetical protein [Facklamia sp. 7083-14-GEN3]
MADKKMTYSLKRTIWFLSVIIFVKIVDQLIKGTPFEFSWTLLAVYLFFSVVAGIRWEKAQVSKTN